MAMVLVGLWVLVFAALACLPLLPAVRGAGLAEVRPRRDGAWVDTEATPESGAWGRPPTPRRAA